MKRSHGEEDLGHSNKRGKGIESGNIKDQNVEKQDTSYHIAVNKDLTYVASEEREIQFSFLCPTKKMDLITQEYQRIQRETETRISINPFDDDHECITVTSSIEELELEASPVLTAAKEIASKCWVKADRGCYRLKMVLTDAQRQYFDAYEKTPEYIVSRMRFVKKDEKNLLEFGGYLAELRVDYEKVLVELRMDAFKLRKGKSIESVSVDYKWPAAAKDETLIRLFHDGVDMQKLSVMLRESQEACSNRLIELGKVSVCAGEKDHNEENEDTSDLVVDKDLSYVYSQEREILFNILCPTDKMDLVNRETERIARETQTCISIDIYDADNICVTVSSLEVMELESSPALTAANEIATKCLVKSGSDCYYLRMLVTDSEKGSLDVYRNTGGQMTSVKKDDKYVLEFDGYLGQLKSNYERVLLMLRKNFFKITK